MTFSEAKNNLKPDNNIIIGQLLKTHGYKGQITVNFKFDALLFDEESVFIRINGWLIPFFIDYTQSNLAAVKPFIKFFNIDSPEQALELVNKYIFLPKHIAKKYIDLNDLTNLQNYNLINIVTGRTGRILELIDNPKNPLIKVQDEKKQETLIPINALEEIQIDHHKNIIKAKIVNGLFD